MVSINTVYQRVLAILNKENRGYLTPQEFNLMANQAQLEIFEQYFYDLNQFSRMGDNDSEYANIIENIEEKIESFSNVVGTNIYNDYYADLPRDLYRIGSISNNNVIFDRVSKKEKNDILRSPLLNIDSDNSYVDSSNVSPIGVYCITGSVIEVYPSVSEININYIRKPIDVSWGYVNVSNTPLFDGTNSVNFELHESDEPSLVVKILSYAGISIKQAEITQLAENKDAKMTTEEKS